MGRFRSAPGAKYFESLELYRKDASEDGSPDTSLFEIVKQIDQQGRLPWLTFVLGSGCLTPTYSGGAADAEAVDNAVRRGLSETGLVLSSMLTEQVVAFVHALVAKKLPDNQGLAWLAQRSETNEENVVPWTVALEAALIAAQSTQEYARLIAAGTYVVDRADKEVIQIPDDDQIASLIENLKSVQKSLSVYKSGGKQGVVAFITLLKAVQEGLGSATEPQLWRAQIEALSGFAWHFLTDGTSIYPGWADMLLFQAASSTLNQNEFQRVPFLLRPIVKNAKPLDDKSLLLERLRRVTKRSLEGDDSDRDDFYKRVAQVLVQQSQVRSRGGSQLPLATAFTASFDIELELALWELTRHETSPIQSFALVAPVYVVYQSARSSVFNTELHWLWREVSPRLGSTAEDLLPRSTAPSDSPALGPWRLIDPTRRQLDGTLQRLPVVVHLAGAPLLGIGEEVRNLIQEHAEKRWLAVEEGERGPKPQVTSVHHALLLDEHLASVQFAEDLLDSPGPGQLHGEFLWSATAPNGVAAPRFWAFVGTQLADPAIRFRLIANEMRALRAPTQANQKATVSQSFAIGEEHGGVVINDWVPAAEREVFRWFGYDVVRGRAQDLLGDLDDFLKQTDDQISSLTQGVAARGAA